MTLPLPIRLLHVDVAGIHPRYARLLMIEIELDRAPDARWIQFFDEAGKGLPWLDMHPPVVVGARITLTPTDEALEQEVAHVEERVAIANARSYEEAAAASRADPLSEHSFSNEMRERIAAAKSRTRMMSEALSVQGFWRSDAWVAEDLMSLDSIPEKPQ